MADHDDHDDHDEEDVRTTAPQSDYTGRAVAIGAVIALVGVAITFGIPLALL